jgi:hypothetical protein
MRISKFTDEQKELIKQWNAQNPQRTFSSKYCHLNVATLNETVFKEQPIPAPTPYQLAQARRDKMAGLRRSQGKRSVDEDFTISVPFKPIIDAMGEEIKKQLQAVLPGIIKPLLKDLVSGSSAAVAGKMSLTHPLCLQVKQQPVVTTPMHRGAAAAAAAGSADTRVSFKAAVFLSIPGRQQAVLLQEPRSKGRGVKVVLSSSPEPEEVSVEAAQMLEAAQILTHTCLAVA